jgi:transcriptional regulator with XRE-family HTH domain
VATSDRAKDLEVARAFGARVRELRLQAELTQEQLAEAAGLHPTFISNLERGYRVPTLVTVLKVASALNLQPEALVIGLPLR